MYNRMLRTVGLDRQGFTLVELLVVLAIIAILTSILIPALAQAQDSARRVKCSGNLRNFGQSMHIYANENKGRLPAHPAPSNWLWDIPRATHDVLVKFGMQRDNFYCPSNDRQHVGRLWNFTPQFTVSGYYYLFRRYTTNNGIVVPGGGPGLRNGAVYNTTITGKDSSERVLASDATISNLMDSRVASFVDVRGGWPEPHWTSHLLHGTRPAGGNVLFLDGRVVWRPFSDMKLRAWAPAQWF